jgi:erythromycin esterase
MGQHLSEQFGDEYHALGFEFGRGTFQACPDPETVDSVTVQAFSVDDPPDGSVPAILSEVEYPHYYLDVRSATDDPPVRELLARERRLHNVGSVYYDDADETYVQVELPAVFDGVVFVAETSRAVPVGGP